MFNFYIFRIFVVHKICNNMLHYEYGSWDAWVAQWLGVCLWLRAWSWSPRIESHIRLPVKSLLLPLPVSLLSLCLSWINKIFKNNNNKKIKGPFYQGRECTRKSKFAYQHSMSFIICVEIKFRTTVTQKTGRENGNILLPVLRYVWNGITWPDSRLWWVIRVNHIATT